MDQSIDRRHREKAEALAVAALGFLAERPEAVGRWLADSGLGPADLRRAMSERAPDLLAAVLDFLRGDEDLASAFAQERGVTAEELALARAALPGGDNPHWV